MSSLFFWKQWASPFRMFWYALSALFIVSLLLMWWNYVNEPSGVIEWQRLQEQKIIETTVHAFRLGPFELAIPAESYAIFEYLQGSNLHHNFAASYTFLFVLFFSVMVLLSIITALEGFWYYFAMTLFVMFAVSLRLDVLELFGFTSAFVPASIVLVYAGVSYFFKSLRPETGFFTRLIIFCVLTLALWFMIFRFSHVSYPFLRLTITTYSSAIVLSLLFVIMVAHEILASFIMLTGQGTSKGLRHFMVVATVYLLNVIIAALHQTGYIEWNFIYINTYLLLTISCILGLWGFRNRENLYETILPFTPFGAYFFLSMAAICFATLSQLHGNANDPAIKVLNDLTIFSHAGFGIAFMLYIFSNFLVMMGEKIRVDKVLYKPHRMPYFTFRLAGVIITLAFVFTTYWKDYIFHSAAGYYNYAADLYELQENETLATAFYEKSAKNSFQTHRANYALGMLRASRFDFGQSEEYFKRASEKNPSDYSLVNQGNLYLWQQAYFAAIHRFKNAEARKTSYAIANNLGYAYTKVHNLDSATYYLSEARQDDLTKSSAEINFLALSADEYLPVKTDSIVKIFKTHHAGVLSNAIVCATLFGQDIDLPIDPLAPAKLDLYTATLLNNYMIRHARNLDTAFTSKAYRIANDSLNFDFSEALKASLAYGLYHQGNVFQAKAILAELAYTSRTYQGKYNYIMGLWALEQHSPRIAHEYFIHSSSSHYKKARLYNAIAVTEARNLTLATEAWDSVARYGDDAEKQIAIRIKAVLEASPNDMLRSSDAEKYQFARYVVPLDDSIYFSRLINTFDNANYKVQTLLDRARMNFMADRIVPAIKLLNQTSGLELTDKKLFDELRHFELLMLASRGETRKLANQINNGIEFGNDKRLEKILYTALMNQVNGDSVNAKKNFSILAKSNPYFEDGILAAANYYRSLDAKSSKSYDVITEAIQINKYSIRLLKAYITEARRQGLDEYAASALQTLGEVEGLLR